jgi:hypothetical protein
MGYQIDLGWYYRLWLIPSGTVLFTLNLGIVNIPVYSWMMCLAIYGRIPIIVWLVWRWRQQAKSRYIGESMPEKGNLLTKWWKTVEKKLNLD